MNNYNRKSWKKLTFQDYIGMLPSSNQIIKRGEDSVLTNCPNPDHEDKNPSCLITQGHTQVVYRCFSKCSQDDLTAFFNSKLRK